MVVESSDDCDFGRVRSVVGRWLPEFEMTSTAKLGEGVDHVAYDVDARLIAKFGTDPIRQFAPRGRTEKRGCNRPVQRPPETGGRSGCAYRVARRRVQQPTEYRSRCPGPGWSGSGVSL
jgi:hypothetical protein